jgi:hypothetical protein
MKLTLSRSDQQMREELVRSNLTLQDGSNQRLANILDSEGVNVCKAYVLNWIPEQAEDIYSVLVSAGEVITVEVPRGDGATLVEREDLARYESKCSKVQKIKIAIARELQIAQS